MFSQEDFEEVVFTVGISGSIGTVHLLLEGWCFKLGFLYVSS